MIVFLKYGFVIVCAFLTGKLVSKFKLPAILGWLLAGMVLGPYALDILNVEIMSSTWYLNMQYIFECVLGIMVGSELVIKNLKESGKQIFVTTIWQSMSTFLVVSLGFMIVFYMMDIPLYLALIFGSIALATAPAPALSIIKEFETEGPVTKSLVPMAALDDVFAILVFFSINSIIIATKSEVSISLLQTLFIMILVPVFIGAPLGYIAGQMIRKCKDKKYHLYIILAMIVLTAALGYVVDTFLLAEPMLNFMLIGMSYAAIFANIIESSDLENLLKNMNSIIDFSLIVVILNLGAPLDYRLIVGAGLFTFIYIATRAIGKYFGARIGAKRQQMPETVQKYLGLTLLPHSGVSLVFTGIAATTLQGFDPSSALIIQSTIAAAAVINEIIAVIVAKKAFTLAGEIPEAS